MNTPLVTVIVPVFNRKQWTTELIASLGAQTYPHDRFEVIVVDNGSTDGLWEWLQEAAPRQTFTMTCRRNDDPAKIPAASRNLAIRLAKGDIVAFTDSDCVVSPEWLAEGVAAFRPGVGVVEGRVAPVPSDPKPVFCHTKTIDRSRLFDTCNVFYTREAVLQVGGFARDFYRWNHRYFGEDFDLGYRVKKAGFESVFAAGALVYHHNRPQTIWKWFDETRMVFSCPYIVRKHPETRGDTLYGRFFLNPLTLLFDLGVLGFVLARFSPAFLALWIPFLVVKAREGSAGLSIPMRLLRLAGGTARACALFCVLLCGSIRFRSLVL